MFKTSPPAPEQQSSAYMPPGPEPLVFEQFQGINTSTSRPGVKDTEMWWSDGFFPIGPRLLRTLPGLGPALWTASDSSEPAGTTIAFMDFGNIGTTPYSFAIMSNGSIYAINTTTGVGNQIAAAGTITNPSRQAADLSQYGSGAILIVAVQTDGYFIWDGSTFYKPGDSYGGGTIPTGIGGSAIEIFTGRVWIGIGPTIIFSAPGSLIDFTTGSGGGLFSSSDSFLRVEFSALVQSNGFLYLIGDSSVNYISNVQSSGSPIVTTFTNQNADPEVGTPWPGTVDTYGRNIVFANSFGAHISYGAAVTKISEPLDGVYNTVSDFGGFVPSAAKAIIYGKKVWILLLPIIDPFNGQRRNKLMIWSGKLWFASEQDESLLFIQHQEISSILTAWGTDGHSIWPMFQQPSDAFTKVVQSRLWDQPTSYHTIKSSVRFWALLQYFSFTSMTVTVGIDSENSRQSYDLTVPFPSMTWVNSDGDLMTWTNDSDETMTWLSSSGIVSVAGPQAVGQQGVLTGLTVTTDCPDMGLISAMLQDEIVAGRF